ncbi:helix-turn-helix domain-containing protein [Kaistella flava (ex Peng et al. 2021)]|uniref:Helix-turn-helix domain-containing protein n=1 Tax=Kaistella flava (ex Peng et al. 2021) TaxID=2038776 RepID=A0A7M2Y4Q2_9FLAO|nr:helix-turn-helix domain-containing protein [Kaistella flava (ex Peng et al. 2021)]QOW09217.1 helix-turn-helix domain-containing protein [Kaistella flava (ex Peng et al. 2021)]
MADSLINLVTINSLKRPFSFDGEFVFLTPSDLIAVFNAQNSFKTKFYTLLIVESGSGNLMIDHEVHELQKGRVFFVNYNQVFRFADVEDFKGEAVLFTRSFYNLIYTGNRKIKNDTAFSDLPSFMDFSKNDLANFKTGVSDMKREFATPALLSKEIICLLLKASMLKYIRKTDNPNYSDFKTNRKNSYIEDFKHLVEVHFKELKRTSDYSQKLTISANYLNALIKEKLDISAENYIQNRVILEAERLLLNTDLSVTEISFELGFSDKSHFGKYFKKNTQNSPNNFRKKFRIENNTF